MTGLTFLCVCVDVEPRAASDSCKGRAPDVEAAGRPTEESERELASRTRDRCLGGLRSPLDDPIAFAATANIAPRERMLVIA